VNDYAATFHTGYGAMKFYERCVSGGTPARLSPVPRKLSSSCGTCVFFTADSPERARGADDLEACYLALPGGDYQKEYEPRER